MAELTREEILAMPAGPEMDALVAERVMGWRPWLDSGVLKCWEHKSDNGVIAESDWSPSTDIAAAWLVVEKIRNTEDDTGHNPWYFGLHDRPSHPYWVADFLHYRSKPHHTAEADEPAVAICRAALLTTL